MQSYTIDPSSDNIEDLYKTYKPHLFSIAHNMLGSSSDAEDMVQDLFISMYGYQIDNINNIKSYLNKMIINRCLNELKSARKKRISYVGNWLPEPTVQFEEHSPLDSVERHTISYAVLILMDKLTPLERAVFILKEVFAYEHREIGEMVNKTEVNCRKIYSRVKKKLDASNNKDETLSSHLHVEKEMVIRFVTALSNGNIQSLVNMLTEDVIFIADGGGKVSAAINAVYNKERVLTILNAFSSSQFPASKAQIVEVNCQPGILITKDGISTGIISFDWEIQTMTIQRVYLIVNPDKLQHLNPKVE
ncbi:MAG: sigma-70 family RNA polymerase sigma factor [Candidatus Pristimantibacillus lignocellulolyticus]|uniref:Sigma-70 family RNA polymerase sigma factor n=1 Tax=Candidatus Pristimantibacillus lignocellulolyticus TaxID=2994561 RepID=A0A9J6ZCE3_9BACL|nr:MAG: sigma-70 family RNA polymerase sigma factor [Candidatus Pristimantibacillus lignocellulolyticus]